MLCLDIFYNFVVVLRDYIVEIFVLLIFINDNVILYRNLIDFLYLIKLIFFLLYFFKMVYFL